MSNVRTKAELQEVRKPITIMTASTNDYCLFNTKNARQENGQECIISLNSEVRTHILFCRAKLEYTSYTFDGTIYLIPTIKDKYYRQVLLRSFAPGPESKSNLTWAHRRARSMWR